MTSYPCAKNTDHQVSESVPETPRRDAWDLKAVSKIRATSKKKTPSCTAAERGRGRQVGLDRRSRSLQIFRKDRMTESRRYMQTDGGGKRANGGQHAKRPIDGRDRRHRPKAQGSKKRTYSGSFFLERRGRKELLVRQGKK